MLGQSMVAVRAGAPRLFRAMLEALPMWALAHPVRSRGIIQTGHRISLQVRPTEQIPRRSHTPSRPDRYRPCASRRARRSVTGRPQSARRRHIIPRGAKPSCFWPVRVDKSTDMDPGRCDRRKATATKTIHRDQPRATPAEPGHRGWISARAQPRVANVCTSGRNSSSAGVPEEARSRRSAPALLRTECFVAEGASRCVRSVLTSAAGRGLANR